MKNNTINIIKRIVIVGMPALLTGLIFYYLRNLLIVKHTFWRDTWTISERTLYIVFAVLVGIIYNYLY